MYDRILKSGIEVAIRDGVASVTVKAVSKHAGISRQTVHSHFMSAHSLRNAVFRECIRLQVLSVVAALIATKHPIAMEIPRNMCDAAIKSLSV